MKTWQCYVQLPKAHKKPIVGTLSIQENGSATIFPTDGYGSVSMERVRIVWAAADGIFLSGFEGMPSAKDGSLRFRYQEWFLRYLPDDGSVNVPPNKRP